MVTVSNAQLFGWIEFLLGTQVRPPPNSSKPTEKPTDLVVPGGITETETDNGQVTNPEPVPVPPVQINFAINGQNYQEIALQN